MSVSSKYIHSSLSVWYLSAAAGAFCSDGIRTDMLEFTINQPEKAVLHAIREKKPDTIAFSCYIWNISFIQNLIQKIAAAMPDTRIILGGPEVSFDSEKILMDNPAVDFIITGEGESPFPELLNRLLTGKAPDTIPGLCFRNENGAIIRNRPGEPLPEPPSPYTPEYFQALADRIAYLDTSRGCPFSCAFCLSGLNGCRVRFFDLERAKRDLLLLANSGAQTVKLVDRTFNCNPGRAYELFDFIINNAGKNIPQGVCFHFEVAADLFDDKTLDLLASAPSGLIQLEAGLQSFNEETLEAVKRKTDLEKLEKSIHILLKNQNIHLHIDLIAGLPFEGLDSFADSFDRAYFLSPHMLQLGFLKMLHGSDLRKKADDLGYIYSKEPPYEVIRTPWLSEEDLFTLRQAEYALQRLYNSGKFLIALNYIIRAAAMRPFSLFAGLGAYLRDNSPMSLDDFTKAAFDYFSGLPGIHPGGLRDAMVCDRIAAGIKIPGFLKIPDEGFKRTLNHIRKSYFQEQKGVKINAAILYEGGKRAVFVDGPKSPVTGRHTLQTIPMDE